MAPASLLPDDTEYGQLAIVLDTGTSRREVEIQAPKPITIPFGGKFICPIFGRDHEDSDHTPVFDDPYQCYSGSIKPFLKANVGFWRFSFTRTTCSIWEVWAQSRHAAAQQGNCGVTCLQSRLSGQQLFETCEVSQNCPDCVP